MSLLGLASKASELLSKISVLFKLRLQIQFNTHNMLFLKNEFTQPW